MAGLDAMKAVQPGIRDVMKATPARKREIGDIGLLLHAGAGAATALECTRTIRGLRPWDALRLPSRIRRRRCP